jgi:hypothetical protein
MHGKSSLAAGLACAFSVAVIALNAAAQISFTGAQYDQDFDSLPTTAGSAISMGGNGPFELSAGPIFASGLSGWQFGKISGDGSSALFRTADGSQSQGAVYSFGLGVPDPENGDRALGSIASGTTISAFGAVAYDDRRGQHVGILLRSGRDKRAG